MLASCIRKDQIPAAYRHMPLLGRGTTSLALDKGDGRVVMLTRDSMKADWLRHGSGVGTLIDFFDTRGHHIPGMDELSVYALEMPRMQRLSRENSLLASRAVREFDGVYSAALSRHQAYGRRTDMDRVANEIVRHYLPLEDHVLHPLFDHLKDYDGKCFSFDLGRRNFMQSPDGTLAVLDPICSTDLLELISAYKKQSAARREAEREGPSMRW